MALAEQEDVLLQLLFNPVLQQRFCEQGVDALHLFSLSKEELQDFSSIRADALVIDANIRKQLLLSQMSKQLPLSFSLFSSLSDGEQRLLEALNIDVMLSPLEMRSVVYLEQLQESLYQSVDFPFIDITSFQNIMLAEQQRLLAGARLIQQHLSSPCTEAFKFESKEHWQQDVLNFGDYVVFSLLPNPFSQLQADFCPVLDSGLWGQLKKQSVTAEDRDRYLLSVEPKVLMSKAVIMDVSVCDPTIEWKTLELSAGFANLFKHIDGATTTQQLLDELKKAGAEQDLIVSIRQTFYQLLEAGMLTN